MYAIKIIKTNRYVKYCDKCWYETSNDPLYFFTKEEAEGIAEQMRSHYIYAVDIIGDDGSVEHINFLKQKTNPMITAKPTKKSIFKFSTKRICK